MTDIEKLLRQTSSVKPGRTLRADFTHTITNYLADHPRKKGIGRLKEILSMNLLTKPAFAAATIAITIAAGGTAYAAVGGWPGVVALFGGEHDLPNGNRIVQVDTKNCTHMSAFTIAAPNQTPSKLYYKIKDGSALTNEQVVQMVQGNCYSKQQATFDQKVIDEALGSNPLNKDRVVGGYADSVVTAISNTSISLESTIPTGKELHTIKQTFNHIAPDVLVYQSPHKLTLADIKVGDHVSIKYRATGEALRHSETTGPDQINPEEQVVVMINKNTPDMTAAINYQKYNGNEFEQVVPCKGQSDGYCTYEQYLAQ